MATTFISPEQDHDLDNNDQIPTATLALPSPTPPPTATPTTNSRRLPPPCWSPDETLALIESYKAKWYSLRRGNLRANHWQEVAEDVASRCPHHPPKTAVQCRHKMEKLRKRYRAEIQRAAAQGGIRRYSSSWAHFHNMHSMEKGSNNPTPPSSSSDEDDEDVDDRPKVGVRRINDLYNQKGGVFGSGGNNQGFEGYGVATTTTPGVRIKIPGRVNNSGFQSQNTHYPNFSNPNPNPRFPNSIPIVNGVGGNRGGLRDGMLGRGETGKREDEVLGKGKAEGGGLAEVVKAIEAMGEGFMRMEKVKMDMVRQVEEMRMEMELKRTEMILESQQRIVDAFAQAISQRSAKRAKRSDSPES